jgi:hypothetical protein
MSQVFTFIYRRSPVYSGLEVVTRDTRIGSAAQVSSTVVGTRILDERNKVL